LDGSDETQRRELQMDRTKALSADFPDLGLTGDEANEKPMPNITLASTENETNNSSQSKNSKTPVPANNGTAQKVTLKKLLSEFTEEAATDSEGFKTIAMYDVKKKPDTEKPFTSNKSSILHKIIDEHLTKVEKEKNSSSFVNSSQPGTGLGWKYTNVKRKTTKPITNDSNVTNSEVEVTSPRIVKKGAKG